MHHHSTATTNSTNTPPATNTNNNNTTILSPRYSEFKMYNSTFDGLQALENSNNHINCSGSGNDINGSANNLNSSTSSSNGCGVPLMRVASLPSMSPAHSGKFLTPPHHFINC